jgi:pyruvate/2-oxoacid:ferredoxin oxidoreductase alpha subunit
MQDAYMEFRYQVQRDMERAKTVVPQVHEEFAGRFGRQYELVDSVQTDDADVVIVCTGTVASTGRVAVETLRSKGKRAGMVKIKALRPFLTEPVIQALRGHAKVAVIDRNISTGGQGVWGQEIKTALYDLPDAERPLIYDYIAGLGGRDISEQTFEEVFDRTLAAERPEDRDIWIGVHYAQPEPEV